MQGGYAQIGYNLLSQVQENIALTPFYRFERLNTQREMQEGPSDPLRDGSFHSFGVEFHPINNVVVKSDYQWLRNSGNTGVNQFNILLGYSF
jgi:hypothetical protein